MCAERREEVKEGEGIGGEGEEGEMWCLFS